MLSLHILVAVLGIVFATGLFFRPTKSKFNYTSVLLVLTLISGTILTVMNPMYMLKSCMLGLAYTAFVASSLYVSKKKLAFYTIKHK